MTASSDARRLRSTHVRGSSLLVSGRLISMLFTVATQVVVVRALTKEDYGVFALALAIVSASGLLLGLGQGQSLSRFVAMYEEARDYGRFFGSIVLAIGTVLVTSAAVFLGLFLARDIVQGGVGGEDAVMVLLVLVCVAPLEALDQIFISLFAVFSRPRAIFVRKYLLAPGLRLAVVLTLALLDRGVLYLAVGYVAASLFGVGLYSVLTVQMLRRAGAWGRLREQRLVLPFRAVFSFSTVMLSAELVFLSTNVVSVVILNAVEGVAEVAEYRSVFPAARLNQFVFASFLTLFLPMTARMFSRGDRHGMRHAYWQTALIMAVFSLPVFAMTGVFAGTTTTTLFGERYAASAAVLSLLATGYYLNVVLGFNAVTLQAFGRLRYVVGVNLAVVPLNVGLAWLLVGEFGALGVAVASCSTLVVQNVLNQMALRSAIGTAFVDRRYLPPYGVILAAIGVLVGVRLMLDPGFVVSAALSVVVWLCVLALTRRHLELAESFPELLRLPVVGRLLR